MRLTPRHAANRAHLGRGTLTPDPTGQAPHLAADRAGDEPAVRIHRHQWRRVLLAATAAAAAVVVLAASPAQAADGGQVLALAGSVDQVLTNLRNWLMGILAGLATVFLTVGGVRYLMAGGDPGEVEKAKSAFKSAGWGYTGAALAPLIVTVLKGLVGA